MKAQGKDWRQVAPMWAACAIPVLWLAAMLAYAYEDGMNLFDLMARFDQVMERPFAIQWTPYTLRFLAGALVLYLGAICLYCSSRQAKRPGEEHGSAHWGSVRELNRKYRDKDPNNNVILTQHLQMGLDGRKHRRNLLQIAVGGSGASKTRGVIKPNIYLANASYLCTDPKGEVARASIPLLLKRGYAIRVFDLVNPARSDCYNPFRYIRSDADVFKLIDNFIKNTTPKNAQQNDPFWESATRSLAVKSQRTNNKYRCLDNW